MKTEGLDNKEYRVDSPISYVGGKSRMSKLLISTFPEHKCYCEAFAGSAWVYFRKPQSQIEVINDLNGDLMNMYKCLKYHKDELIKNVLELPISRKLFDAMVSVANSETYSELTDIQRATSFYYRIMQGFGGKVIEQGFSAGARRSPKLRSKNIEKRIDKASERLQNTVIECLPYSEVIHRYDTDETLFYLDPPYYGIENYYGKGLFERKEYDKLAEQLRGINGKFIMTLNNRPEVKAIFQDFNIREADLHYSLNKKGGKWEANELIISNYDYEINTDK